MKRVVVTGYGVISPIGNTKEDIISHLKNGKSGIKYISEWENIKGFETRLAGIVDLSDFSYIPRKYRRTMGRVALLSAFSVQSALDMANIDDKMLSSYRTGLAFGSTMGSLCHLYDYYDSIINGSMEDQKSTSFLKVMSHTCAANIAQMFKIRGRVIASCTACVASSQSIGYGYETIKYGLADVMICGGAEEMHFTSPGVFEKLYATSIKHNATPDEASRPFDADRDGLVTSEGSATVILEDYEHAVKRGAHIYAEVLGFSTNCDGNHLTSPTAESMADVMKSSLESANLTSEEIDYINAHATATEKGDIAESIAVENIFGNKIPISSTKGYTGHMLGGCGAMEFIISIFAIQENFLPINKNLYNIDSRCAKLNYITEDIEQEITKVMTNNFAFGGINTSIILGEFNG